MLHQTLLTIQFKSIAIGFFCGFGLFIYGITLMSNALRNLSQKKVHLIISKLTNNPFKGLIVGALLTGVLQSSSGTIAITIGFVRSGLLSLPQAIGVIMGANIGTTATAFLIGLNVTKYAPIFVGFGAIFIFFSKKPPIITLGEIVLGFGLLFYGMGLMGSQLELLSDVPKFQQFMLKFSDQPFLGLLIGLVLTAIVQSSSVTIGILQNLYVSGLVNLKGALPILFGNNIGTTVTGIMASIGGNTTSKRVATFQVGFNIFGAILFLLILNPYHKFVIWFITFINASPFMAIAYAHILFNLFTALILIWFVSEIETILLRLIKH